MARLGEALGRPAGRPPEPVEVTPLADASLEPLVASIAALCTADQAERVGHAAQARAAAERLAAQLSGRAAELAGRVARVAAELEGGGADVPRAIARAGAELVGLRTELARQRPAARPDPGSTAEPTAPRANQGDEQLVRVQAARLDRVANDVDQLVVGVSRRERRSRDVQRLEKSLRETLRLLERGVTESQLHGDPRARPLTDGLERLRELGLQLGRHARETRRDSEQERLLAHGLRGALQSLRMVPAGTGLAALRPAVRELAAQLGKEVALHVSGGELRLDRRVLEELKSPLLHLVRNALDHGVESPAGRRAAGKPEQAVLEVRVEARGARVHFTVRDDGAGLSPDRLRAAAVKRGLVRQEEAARLSDGEAARLAFQPGLSTATEVTAVSGRGVGLDVVAEAVRRLGGDVDVTFQAGHGTSFELEVPLTISGATGLLFRAAGGTGLLPVDAVERVLLVEPADVTFFAGQAAVVLDGEAVPFTSMAQALGAGVPPTPRGTRVALLVTAGGKRMAFAIDELLGTHAIIVSSLGRRLAGARHVAGATVLDDGRVVSVLQPALLVGGRRPVEPSGAPARPRVIVADDALSTRTTMKHLLEVAGYVVLPAADGEAALALAREVGCDLVVSDVQMPRLDGLGLTRRLKADPRLARVPVVLVTSLDSPEDRAAGLEAGADGYLVKRDVQRGHLIELVRQLLPA
jgi:two-component system chemotaxis sensor kinase CheA